MFAKKSLGQHWLRSERVAKKIVTTADLKAGETVLEIGPGTGFLTKHLLATGAEIIAVEKDGRAIELLQEKFASELASGKLNLFHNDILETDLAKLKLGKYKLVANIPYYLTGQIIRQFLSAEKPPELAVLLVQDEVAKRICASPRAKSRGHESILSISVKVYGTPKYIEKVPAKMFVPVPQVNSAILLVSNISKNNFQKNKIAEDRFFALVKRGFGSKRKMLKNNLDVKMETLTACGITPKARAENLTLNQWLCLATPY